MAVVSDHTARGVVAVGGTVAVSRGEGASTAVVHQSTANSSFNDSSVADVPPVLMLLSTAMLHRPAEDHHLYTARPDILSTC